MCRGKWASIKKRRVADICQDEEAVKAVGGFTQIWVLRSNGKAPKEGLEPRVRKGLEELMQPEKAEGSKL